MKSNTPFTLLISAILLNACKKNTPPANTNNTGKCFITRYDNKHINNPHYYTYEYSADNTISKMSRFVTGTTIPSHYKTIDYASKDVLGTKSVSISGKIHLSTVYGYNAYFKDPAKATLTIEDFSTGVNISHISGYFRFTYDTKNRLIKVEQTTPAIGDWEYDLEIFYNDHDNVTRMEYEWTTGPRDPKAIVSVSAYDDKPNPYSSMPQWKFISDAGWNFYDPEAMLTALSKNNPLDYTLGTFKRKMEYIYNEKGYPVKRMNTNTNLSGQYKFEELFTYQCN